MKALANALILLIVLGTSAGASAQDDPALLQAVAQSVRTYPRLTIFDDVEAEVDGGVVTLTGQVTLQQKRDELGARVASLSGVRQVRNDIVVLKASSRDDTLRRKIARAIYGNPAFWRYAAMPHPPIHILVEDGHVRLTGVVPSDVDRALAQSLATGHGESGVTNALRTTG